jgi:2'-hydroxybiphenyl-2-sulfinate desulfinase
MSVKEFRYTICPVGNASFISAGRHEFLRSAFRKLGISPVLLQSLPRDKWHVHYDYQDHALFREGGNIPPIWAKSNGAEVVLLGAAFLQTKQYVLARIDSDVEGVEDLRGRRLALPVRPDAVVDFYSSVVRRGFERALAAKGVSAVEVEFVAIVTPDVRNTLGISDVDALDRGYVDAVFARYIFAQRLLASGKYKIIYEVTGDPDHFWPLNNEYPNVLTVSRKLAEDAPEVVIEYVRQTILAARWAKTHLPEVVTLFAKQLDGSPGEVQASLSPGFHKDLEPNLSEKSLLALESQKRFLFDHGVIKNDFDIDKWKDESFLASALRDINQKSQDVAS